MTATTDPSPAPDGGGRRQSWVGLMVGEAARMALSQPVASIVVGLVVAAVCGVIVATTGQTVATERDVLARIDDAGTRSILIRDSQGTAGITPAATDRLRALSAVEWVLALGPATDVRPRGIPGGDPVAIRTVYGPLPSAVTSSPWQPSAGTAIVGPDARTALGMPIAAGGVTGPTPRADIAVVGWFDANEPLTFLNASLLTAPDPDTAGTISQIHMLVTRPDMVEATTQAALAVLDPDDLSSVTVETSEQLARIRSAIAGELGRFGRNLVSLVLTAGLVLVGLSVYGAVTTRQRDFGRRRALGASRLDIVGLVTTQTLLVAIIGVTVGTTIGAAIVWRTLGIPPDPRFTLAIAVLATLMATTAALPPALIAAYRDPVRIVRIP